MSVHVWWLLVSALSVFTFTYYSFKLIFFLCPVEEGSGKQLDGHLTADQVQATAYPVVILNVKFDFFFPFKNLQNHIMG